MKQKKEQGGIIYSTDPSYKFEEEPQEELQIAPAQQVLKVKLDTKNRGGKAVTVVDGYKGKGMEELGKLLKTFCGTGGAVKDGQIIIQGDNREKVKQWLLKNGFKKTT